MLATGVTNRVLYKMALVPLKDHIFFLAQLQNLGYLAVYFTALALRSRWAHRRGRGREVPYTSDSQGWSKDRGRVVHAWRTEPAHHKTKTTQIH